MGGGFFVTGTDTSVGKTLVSLGLMRLLRQQGHSVAGMKPVASGCEVTPAGLRNPDALALHAWANVILSYEQVNPYAYEAPVAPHVAAAETGQPVNISELTRQYRQIAALADYVIVEGAGGWNVPLGDETDVSDLARALGLPVVLVVAVRLGCLNHAILTWEAIRATGMPCAGWVANCMDNEMLRTEENVACLTARLGIPLLGTIPYLDERLGEDVDPIERVANGLALHPQFL